MRPSLVGAGWQRLLQSVLLALFTTSGVLVCWTHPPDDRSWIVPTKDTSGRSKSETLSRLGHYVIPGTVVVDVGANIGFFTDRFARWVGPDGRVLAIKPEAVNFARLQRRILSGGISDRVELVRAAACDRTETVLLNINPDHPGDHRLSNRGVPVRGLTWMN